MKLKISEIGPAGIDIAWQLTASEVKALLLSAGVEVAGEGGAAELRGRVIRVEETLVLTGAVAATFEFPCARCLGPASIRVDEPELAVTFEPMGKGPMGAGQGSQELGDVEIELSAQDLDTLYHDGETLDLEPLLRETLVLAIPIAPLCRPDCRGVCKCGADLNHQPCRCEGSHDFAAGWKATLARLREGGEGQGDGLN